MGSFNRMGFYSKLPITYGDDIVLIICCTTNKFIRDANPCDADDDIQPLFLPVRGKYDEYGGIKDYDDSDGSTVKTIENIIGLKFDKLISCLQICSFETIYDIEKAEKLAEEKKCTIYDNDIDYKTALTNIISLCDETDLEFNGRGLLYTLERCDVYDKMVSMSKDDIGTIINNRLNFRKEKEIKGFVSNNISVRNWATSKAIESGKYDKNFGLIYKNYTKDDIKVRFSTGDTLCEGYKNYIFNTENEFKEVIDFMSFHTTLNRVCGSYSISQYGSQDIIYRINLFNELNNLYASIISSKKKNYNE